MDIAPEMSGTDLMEHALTAKSEAARDAALERIDEKVRAVGKLLDAGVSPAEFKRLDSVRSALGTAHTVVTRACKVATGT